MEIIGLIKQATPLKDELEKAVDKNEKLFKKLELDDRYEVDVYLWKTNEYYWTLDFYDSRIKDLLNTIISNKVSLENQRALTTTINSIRFLRYKDNISDELRQLFYKYDCYYQDIPVEGINKFDNTEPISELDDMFSEIRTLTIKNPINNKVYKFNVTKHPYIHNQVSIFSSEVLKNFFTEDKIGITRHFYTDEWRLQDGGYTLISIE